MRSLKVKSGSDLLLEKLQKLEHQKKTLEETMSKLREYIHSVSMTIPILQKMEAKQDEATTIYRHHHVSQDGATDDDDDDILIGATRRRAHKRVNYREYSSGDDDNEGEGFINNNKRRSKMNDENDGDYRNHVSDSTHKNLYQTHNKRKQQGHAKRSRNSDSSSSHTIGLLNKRVRLSDNQYYDNDDADEDDGNEAEEQNVTLSDQHTHTTSQSSLISNNDNCNNIDSYDKIIHWGNGRYVLRADLPKLSGANPTNAAHPRKVEKFRRWCKNQKEAFVVVSISNLDKLQEQNSDITTLNFSVDQTGRRILKLYSLDYVKFLKANYSERQKQ